MTDQCKAGKFMLGITGGVGSGKSRILAILKEDYGFHVIQADQVAKDLMQPGMESYLAVVGYLGPSVLLEDKSLDRAAMAEIIFHDPEKRRGVDERTHPLVWKAAMEEAMAEVNMVVEGVYSAKAALALSRQHHVSMPIVEQVNAILFGGMPAKEAVLELMLRDKRIENSGLEWEEE